ncbi:hypothetical protein [Cumulibacter manganitolerans]|uniref:hypothetical protein n=1 Tax=Cumulibacter manganitolerans TaxID=1884992 RepID=UPI0012962E2A|nr:hypothetical protein [Cumulibacter manganitolerans]
MLLPLGLVLAVLAGVVTGIRARPAQRVALGTELAAYEARAQRFRVAALAVAIVTSLLAASTGALGRGLLLAPAVFAVTVMAVVAVGELIPPPPGRAGRRRAGLDVRSPRRYRPRALGTALAAVSSGLVLVLGVTAATASPDDVGRRGRALAWICRADADGITGRGSTGPYPGSYYAIPVAVAIGAVLLLWAVSARVVAARGSLAADVGEAAQEDLLRARSMCAITAAATAGVSASLAAVAAGGAGAMYRASGAGGATCHGSAGYAVGGWLLIVIALAASVVTGWALARLLVQRGEPSIPQEPRTGALAG